MRAKVHSKLGHVDEDGTFHLAKISRKEIGRARAKAHKAIAAHGHRAFNDLRPAEVEAASASYFEPFVRQKIAEWKALPKQGKALQRKIEEAEKELARLLTLQGRFGEAAEVHADGQRLAAAAHKPDAGEGAWCRCKAKPVDDGQGGHLQPLQFERTEIVSEVHGGVVSLWRCKSKKCQCENISPEPPPQDAWFYQRQAIHGRNRDVRDEHMLKAT